MAEANAASLQDELHKLEQLYAQGEITETLYRAALVGLGLDAEQIRQTVYNIHIDRAEGTAIGDRSQAGVQPETCPPALDESDALARDLALMSPRPVLIIHSADDAMFPLRHARQMYEAAQGPKELWVVSGLPHVNPIAGNEEEYKKRVIAFLDGAFGDE